MVTPFSFWGLGRSNTARSSSGSTSGALRVTFAATCHSRLESSATEEPDLPSLMLYTSGTTGFPKGALISERNLDETSINSMMLYDVDSCSGFLVDSPMFHIIGLISSVRPVLLRGGHIVISDGFIPERTLERCNGLIFQDTSLEVI